MLPKENTDGPLDFIKAQRNEKKRVIFVAKDNEHCSIYFENLRHFLSSSGFELIRLSYADRPLSNAEKVLISAEQTIGVISLNHYAFFNPTYYQSLDEMIKCHHIPHVIYFIDHPIYYIDSMNTDDQTLRYIFLDQRHIPFMRRFTKAQGTMTTVANVNVFHKIPVSKWSTEVFLQKRPQVVLPVTFNWRGKTLPDCLQMIDRYDVQSQQLIWGCIEEFRAQNSFNLLSGYEFLTKQSKSFHLSDQESLQMLGVIDHYITIWRRLFVLRIATKYPLLVIGDGVPDNIKNGARAEFCPRLPMEKFLKRIARAKVIIDASQASTPCHDRISTAMASGSVALTVDNAFIQQHFKVGQELLVYNHDEEQIKKTLDFLFSDDAKLADIAYCGWQRWHDPQLQDALYGNFISMLLSLPEREERRLSAT